MSQSGRSTSSRHRVRSVDGSSPSDTPSKEGGPPPRLSSGAGRRDASAHDDSHGAATAGEKGGGGHRAVAEDALVGSVPDRQILVVGTTLSGLAVATLLDRGGYDPVVVENSATPDGSRAALLWPPSFDVLSRLGIDESGLGTVRTVEEAAVNAANGVESVGTGRGSGASPVAITTERLRDRLREAGPTPTCRGLAGIHARDGSMEVTFDDGVREWFDAVIGADGPESHVRSLQEGPRTLPRLDQFEAVVPADDRDRAIDAWSDRALAQLQPLPCEGDLLRLTVTAGERSDRERLHRELAAFESGTVPAPGEGTPVRYAGVAQADRNSGTWGGGRVAYCGACALPLAPATGLRTALALEDAWVLSDELVRGSRSVTDAVRTYGNRRERRIDRLLSAGTGTCVEPTGAATPALVALWRFRDAALSWFEDPTAGGFDP